MSDSLSLKLTVYRPDTVAGPGEQVGFEYDLNIVAPDLNFVVKGHPEEASAARCDVVPVSGTLSFPNPAAPVVSPFAGLMFIYDNAPILRFPLTILAQGTADVLKFNMNLMFPASPLYFYSGAIKFGEWPGPFRNVAASFLCPQPT